jgi:hypothetical protein
VNNAVRFPLHRCFLKFKVRLLQKMLCLRLSLLFLVLGSSGCSSFPDTAWIYARSPTPSFVVIADATAPGACSEASLQRLLRSKVELAADNGGSVALYRLDTHEGAHLVATFTPSAPSSQAKKVLALHREEMIHEAERLFATVIPTIFTDVPKTSPIAAAILTAAASRPGPVELYIATDLREVSSIANFERGNLPLAKTWSARLATIGYTTESLRGVSVHIVGMPLIATGDQDASPARGLAIQKLWHELTSFGATKVTFDEGPQGAYLIIFTPLGYFWRRFRIWIIGRRDGSRHDHNRRRAAESLIGPKPLPEFDDPRVADATSSVQEERGIMARIKEELKDLMRAIARLPWYLPLIVGIGLAGMADASGTTSQFADLGAQRPERYVYGIAMATCLIALAGLAGKASKVTGKRPGWWYLIIAVTTLISISITIVRVMNAATTGDPLIAEIANGILQLCTVVGPALISELLFERLRLVMPLVRHQWSLNRQLRESRRTYKKAIAFLTKQARLRQSWEFEYTVLCAIYDRAYAAVAGSPPNPPSHHDQHPTPPTPQPQVNGLPQWPQ